MVLRTIISLFNAAVKFPTAMAAKAISLIIENAIESALLIGCILPILQQAAHVVFRALYFGLWLWFDTSAASPETAHVAVVRRDRLLLHLVRVLYGVSCGPVSLSQ